MNITRIISRKEKRKSLKQQDDMKCEFNLTRIFRFAEIKKGRFRKVMFRKISNLSNARWNFREILVILIYILRPEERHITRNCLDSSLTDGWAIVY